MWDIAEGVLIIAVVSAGLFWCGWRLSRRQGETLVLWLAVAVTALTLLFALSVHGTLLVARVLPVSNAIVVGNWIPLGATFLVGIVGGLRKIPLWRRIAFALILLLVAWYSVGRVLVRRCPASQHDWTFQGVAMQSRGASCGPCCAVMLLRHCGIEADEREMIDLCLTNRSGTPSLGLYRGLKIKTADTAWDVEVVRCDAEQLLQRGCWPVILNTRLDVGDRLVLYAGIETPNRRPHGFGVSWPLPTRREHTVVVFGRTDDGQVDVGDPAVGRLTWPLDRLENAWGGDGLRLVPRGSPRFPRASGIGECASGRADRRHFFGGKDEPGY
jgi:predicted double-glycine peptidase